jgi:AraC family transcriptional regulator, activator of mtrCDE
MPERVIAWTCCAAASSSRRRTSGCCGTICQPDWSCRRPIIAPTARPGTSAQLAGLVSLLRIESAADSLGGRAMLNALSTAMFALTLRLASEAPEAPAGLLALAGHPRLAPALSALFHEPRHSWTLPELARLCHMSRATMARHFQEKLGRSASELLTDIRMMLAAQELGKATVSTGAVAAAVGYQSEAAFQRAFKKRMGITPAAWRRAAHTLAGGKIAAIAADT